MKLEKCTFFKVVKFKYFVLYRKNKNFVQEEMRLGLLKLKNY